MSQEKRPPTLDPLPVQSMELSAHGEHQDFDRARVDSASFAAGRVTRSTLQPGWKWSASVGRARGLELCTAPHLGYVIAGRMTVRVANGSEYHYGAGDAYAVSPEPHDAWVEGEATYVAIDVTLPARA
jgi:uncharacterized cupin superfamily protein